MSSNVFVKVSLPLVVVLILLVITFFIVKSQNVEAGAPSDCVGGCNVCVESDNNPNQHCHKCVDVCGGLGGEGDGDFDDEGAEITSSIED